MDPIIWVGLDVHKNSITAAILDGDNPDAEVVKLPADLMKLRRLFGRLSTRGTVRSCYEASGAGFVVHRVLADDGYTCEVIAPTLIPRKVGDRRKTDRLDAIRLARLYRGGHLTPVQVPSEEQEAVRSVVRLRLAYQRQVTRTKYRINGMLLAQGHVFRGTKSNWTKKHRAWLSTLRTRLDGPQGMCLAVELEHLEYLETQLGALDAEIDRIAAREPYRPTVEALQCLRGVKTLTAMTLATEIGDIHRFRSPQALMAWIGLVPSERSSGERERRGPITKTGNGHVRRVLVEAAWNNHHRSGANLILNRRRQGQPPGIVGIAVKAQHRLSKRFYRLSLRTSPSRPSPESSPASCGR